MLLLSLSILYTPNTPERLHAIEIYALNHVQ